MGSLSLSLRTTDAHGCHVRATRTLCCHGQITPIALHCGAYMGTPIARARHPQIENAFLLLEQAERIMLSTLQHIEK